MRADVIAVIPGPPGASHPGHVSATPTLQTATRGLLQSAAAGDERPVDATPGTGHVHRAGLEGGPA
jgi:hypothetical protein